MSLGGVAVLGERSCRACKDIGQWGCAPEGRDGFGRWLANLGNVRTCPGQRQLTCEAAPRGGWRCDEHDVNPGAHGHAKRAGFEMWQTQNSKLTVKTPLYKFLKHIWHKFVLNQKLFGAKLLGNASSGDSVVFRVKADFQHFN